MALTMAKVRGTGQAGEPSTMSDLDRMLLQEQPLAGTPIWGGAGAGGVGRLLTRLLKIFKQGKAPKPSPRYSPTPTKPVMSADKAGNPLARPKGTDSASRSAQKIWDMEKGVHKYQYQLAKKASETGPSKWAGAKDFPKLADESPEFLARHGLFRSQGGKVFRSQDRPWETLSPEDLLGPMIGTTGAIGGGLWALDHLRNDNKSFPEYPPGWPEFAPLDPTGQQPAQRTPSLSPEQMLQLIAGQDTAPYSTEESPPPPGYMDYLLQQAFGRRTPGPMPMGMERQMRMNR